MIDHTSRRTFLSLGLAAIAAPAVIRIAQLMPIKALKTNWYEQLYGPLTFPAGFSGAGFNGGRILVIGDSHWAIYGEKEGNYIHDSRFL